ncbi:MAG: GNAT family N-acetyltransferase, partial [Thermodesulfobacteriota bacterium]
HEEGVYLNAIPYPAVSKGSERFRLSILATHTKEDLEQTLGVLEKVGKEFGVIRKIIPLQYLRNNKTIVQEVKSEKEIEESVRFSWRVYENSPAWVPYFLVKEQTRLISGEYFYFRKITNKRFIVRDSGDIVGTISAFVDKYFNLLYNKRVGYLGFFEALPNREKAINLLINKAIEFLKRENCKEVWAPINGIFELIGGGTLSDGFEKEPSFLQVYNPSYYREYFVQSGFMPLKQTLHYTINLDNQEILERVNSLSKKSLIPELRIRKINKSDWENEVRRILKVFNESFVHLWFGIPLEYQEFIEFANKFKRLIIPDFWLIAEINDEPVGFIGGFPNYVKIFRELNGNIKFTKFLKLTLQIHRIDGGSILLFGVVDKYRKTGVGPLLSSRLCRAMIEKGYSSTAAAWILEDNTDCRRVAEWLGGKVDKTWTIYGKNLND